MKNSRTSTVPALAGTIEPLESRIAPAFATVLDLSTLSGPNGFQFHLAGFTDIASISTQEAGDVNGDGFADIIAAADYRDFQGVRQLASFVVFGKSGAFPAKIDLLNLPTAAGFKIGDSSAGDAVTQATAAGDINDDGFADLAVSGSGTGLASADYVLFGHSGAFPAVVPLASIGGAGGLKINDGARGVVAAGDINGDGIDDLLINVPVNGGIGSSYVIFGRSGAFAGTIELSSLSGTDGFKINGDSARFLGSFALAGSGAGDVNGDGFDDLIIAAPFGSTSGNGSGVTYVIFGHSGAFPAAIGVSSLDGTNGFKLAGRTEDLSAGISVSGVGDINRDGFDDVAVGSIEGDVYVVFGHSGVFPVSIDLPSLSGPTGFVLGTGPRDDDGRLAVSSAGDVNNDGFDDILVGDSGAEIFLGDDDFGVSYVIYGHAGAFPDRLALSSLDGTAGFLINGEGSGSRVDGAGDVNGDGFDDVLIAGSQTSYVLFGPGFTRLAPTIAANGRAATFIDADGDRVTVTVTRGTLDASNFAIHAAPGGVPGGGHFGGLDLSDPEFAGAKLKITAERTKRGGDGYVNLGFLDATGIDLREVKIRGDLGRVAAGDSDLATPAINTLQVVSMGVFGLFTQFDIPRGIESESRIVGSIANMKVLSDLRNITLIADGLGVVKIGGSIGSPFGETTGGTYITLTDDLTSLSVRGDIQYSRIYAGGDIGHIAAGRTPGKFRLSDGITVKGSIVQSEVRAGGDLARIAIGGSVVSSGIVADGEATPADLLAAQTIGEIAVGGGVVSSNLTVGGADHPDVQIGKVSVGTNWVASSLSVAKDGLGGNPAIVASVARIVIGGQALGTVGGTDQFRLFSFYAEKIAAFQIGKTTLPMTGGPDLFNLGITFDLTVRDLV